MRNYRASLFVLIVSSFIFACNPASKLPNGNYLLVRNKIVTDTTILAKEQYENYLKQKPNRRILGIFKFHLGVYNLGISGKDSKFKKWLRSIGEEPVVFDSALTDLTKQQFNIFLNKNGFFNATISDSVKLTKKKARITYFIKYNQPYTIRSLTYNTQDTGLTPLINYLQQTSLLIPGDRYDEDIIDKERERITADIKDRGYYFFNRNYITFQIDSTLNSHKVDIYLYINRVNENAVNAETGNFPIADHKIYFLRNIYVHADFNTSNPNQPEVQDTTYYNGYYIISTINKQRILRDNVLTRNLFIKSGDRYLQRDLDYTYKRLQELNVFKFINLYFIEVPRDTSQKPAQLDLHVQLTPSQNQDYTIESEATNTGGSIGIAGSIGYRNKNTFRDAGVLELKIKGGLEAIPNFNSTEETKKLYFFNTYEIGPQLSLGLKRFLLPPFITKNTSPYANPKTNIVVGYNYQERPDYKRQITNFALNYQFSPSKRQRFIVYFPDINSVIVDLSDPFKAKLDTLDDPRLFYAYDTHIITATQLTWIYSDQIVKLNKNFIYFRVTGERSFNVFDRRFNPALYTKGDFDFSYHRNVNRYMNVVYRLAAGYGEPYGNSSALPFEKSFFSGGANSVRAWETRTLGPGTYKNDIYIEQSGDIKIETNIEYRSELVRFPNGVVLEGATFIDAGNIWTRYEDVSRPGGKFEWGNAISELGVGGGAGFRFNFSFFVLRVDAAVKLRDPSLEKTNRWVYPNKKFEFRDIVWNIAIGYPF